MLRLICSIGIVLSFLATGVLCLYGLAGQGVNDFEWGTIRRTGLPTHPELFVWSQWRPNDGSVHPFIGYGDVTSPPPSLPEFRTGRASNIFLAEFVAYQGRYMRNGALVECPAHGPNWGFKFRWIFPALTFVFAGLFTGFAVRLSPSFAPQQSDEEHAATKAV